MTDFDSVELDLASRDAACLWHPATHFRDLESLPPLPIAAAEGCELITSAGERILDGISSWWTCLHGHGHPRIVEAVSKQAARLDHVMFAGFTHAPAVELAERLLAHAPREASGESAYGKVFYSDCGSASIEVAMKLSFQSHLQRGEPQRRRFATLANSYHGETMGALSVCGADAYRELFSPLLLDVVQLPAPNFPGHRHADLAEGRGHDDAAADAACALLDAHAHELSALLIEPVVQCAGKMAMTGTGYYARICEHAQSLGIHVIADEIAVGFGRTGRLLTTDWTSLRPDMICLSKGLSGGVLPLAATLLRRGFEDDFKGAPSRSFMHSHTFTGNPVACAAGVASFDMLVDERIPALAPKIAAMARALESVAADCPEVRAWRQAGFIGALELEVDAEAVAGGRLGLALRRAALEAGVLLRPLHDTIYWMPPLIAGEAEIERLREASVKAIRQVCRAGESTKTHHRR